MHAFIYLPFFAALSCLFFRTFHLRKIKAHVQNVYPDEWNKLCNNRMGMNITTISFANLEESMKNGFLSKQKDPLIQNFHRKDKLMITSMFVFTILQLGLAFYN
ncbi:MULTISPECIES: hypothetical protein [Pseudoalteromonas]|uniref:hypothetical protein n=1 Tax=Pseudoalteromonas TaxID=53246 RepID=UPI000FFE7B65|nr:MULTISPECIES: hypothetical protein [Pseudoalteromonas]MCG9760909.1 hypothetical protein [Pseudoalteromonas sp. Isolate6]NKC21629.1 hypothetical protein [Pseudoalteromonas galatheae]RXE88310.1 hypothetical protein DRB05_04065 [Pseudoalteromonas sp. A757]